MFDAELNAVTYGLPQDRRRAWFGGVRKDISSDSSEETFHDMLAAMEISQPLHLSQFILPAGQSYLAKVKEQKMKKSRGPRSPKLRVKWKVDHWKCRRKLVMLAPTEEVPENIKDVTSENMMGDREADLWRLLQEAPSRPDPSTTPSVELKDSAARVVKFSAHAKRRFAGSTSTLLPASRLMIQPPLVPHARYMCGAEALALQGLPLCYSITDPILLDAEYLHLAGNAYSGACAAAVFLSTLASVDASKFEASHWA